MEVTPAVQLSLPIRDATQVGDARRQAVRLAQRAGMGETEQGAAAIVATELATNLVKHASGGELLLQCLDGADGALIEIVSLDSGPGMDVERCMRDGFSTTDTLGTGLGAVRRLALEFDAFSVAGAGTVIVARVAGAPSSAPPAPFEWGAVCMPMHGETVCGDAWRVRRTGTELRVMVADGLGHGPAAGTAASAAAALFDQQDFVGPGAFLAGAHAALTATRGAAVLAAVVSRERGKLTSAGAGNVAGTLVSPAGSQGLVSHHGTVGGQMRRVQEFEYDWPQSGVLILHSDGLESRWRQADHAGLFARHSAVIASTLYRDHCRGRDDVTVVAVRMRG